MKMPNLGCVVPLEKNKAIYLGRRTFTASKYSHRQKIAMFIVVPGIITLILLSLIYTAPKAPLFDSIFVWLGLALILFAFSACIVALFVGIGRLFAKAFASLRGQSIQKRQLQ